MTIRTYRAKDRDHKILDDIERLPAICDKFCDNTVVLPLTGFGAIFSKVIHFASNSDIGSA